MTIGYGGNNIEQANVASFGHSQTDHDGFSALLQCAETARRKNAVQHSRHRRYMPLIDVVEATIGIQPAIGNIRFHRDGINVWKVNTVETQRLYGCRRIVR